MKKKQQPWWTPIAPRFNLRNRKGGMTTAHRDADYEVINLTGSEMEEDEQQEVNNEDEISFLMECPPGDGGGAGGGDEVEEMSHSHNTSNEEIITITSFEPIPSSDNDDGVVEESPPRPSTSAAARKRRIGAVSSSPQPSTSKSSCGNIKGNRKPKNKKQKILSDSENSEINGDADSERENLDDDDDTEEPSPKFLRRRRKKKVQIVESSEDEDESNDRSSSKTTRARKRRLKSKKPKNVKKRTLRSSTEKKKSKKDEAFEKLKKLREKRKEKNANRKSPVREVLREVSSDDEKEAAESSSSYITDSDFVVNDGYEYDAEDTPYKNVKRSSSSSSTSSGDAEEVDLESGSEGEKDVVPDPVVEEEDEKSDRTSSSSEGEAPDDGQNDPRCILCKNLGSRDFHGRSLQPASAWCRCGECDRNFSVETGDYDLICCKEIHTVHEFVNEEQEDDVCVTKHPRFERDVLNNEGYARAISKFSNYGLRQGGGAHSFYEYNFSRNAEREKKRDAALAKFKGASIRNKYLMTLTSFKYWIFDCLKYSTGQMVVPACVHKRIREHFGFSRNYHLFSFRSSFCCPSENGNHCRATFHDPNNYQNDDDAESYYE